LITSLLPQCKHRTAVITMVSHHLTVSLTQVPALDNYFEP